jgi:hypothetical protein
MIPFRVGLVHSSARAARVLGRPMPVALKEESVFIQDNRSFLLGAILPAQRSAAVSTVACRSYCICKLFKRMDPNLS